MLVYFLFPYPLAESPSQRFRFEQYFALLKKHNIPFKSQSFFDQESWHVLYTKGNLPKKITGLLKGYLRRILVLFRLAAASHVFIHRELTPLGPPVFEWIISKVLRKKIIYDFDDAIWHTDLDKKQWLKIWLKNTSKIDHIIRWAWKVSCGNEYLCAHARTLNSNVVLNPTTIDTEELHNQHKDQHTAKIAIGWTGSHSTLKFLAPLVPVIEKLEKELDFDFVVICNHNPGWKLRSMKFIPWKKDTEIEDLMRFNFGLMPLPDDEWSKGKCGFKALQYMALGMPALVSPVGVNTEIVEDGVNGFICNKDEEWLHAMRVLLKDEALRIRMGEKAKEKIMTAYSVKSNTANFLSLFEK